VAFDVVAFSCYIWNIRQTLEVAREIKAISPGTKILLGGPEVSYDWESVIARPEVDFIITGEGETPFRDFLTHYPDTQNLPNLVQKAGEQILYHANTTNFDLAHYADIMPYADDNPEELKGKVLYVETSRGCPYKCEFCLASLDNKVRYLPDTHIKRTLSFLMDHGRNIKFLDRTFNVKRDFTLDIFRFILKNHRPGNLFQFEITADILHPDIARFILEEVPAGLFRFEIGIQSVQEAANRAVGRKQNFDKIATVVKQLQHKVDMHLDLIVGLPYDGWEEQRNNFETVFKLYPPELQLGFLKFLKGTPMLDKQQQHGYTFDPEPPYQILQSKYLEAAELQKIMHLEQALEIYWNKRRANYTLRFVAQTRSIFDFMVDLGSFFAQRADPHRHTLQQVYDLLFEFVVAHHASDLILRELVAIDYYLYQKTPPPDKYLATRSFSAPETNHLRGKPTRKNRLRVLPLSFKFNPEKHPFWDPQTASDLTIHYDGIRKGVINC
jgi:anaerobic magnesium-protoporphyrin IX monomethyl ester cyclase